MGTVIIIIVLIIVWIIGTAVLFYRKGRVDEQHAAYEDYWKNDALAKQVTEYFNNPPKE